MARFEKSRPKSTKPHAAVAARPRASTAPSIEDTMFFPRIRRHAKWMFVFLALVFGLGFVIFGVGAGGTGIGDIFRDQNTSSGESVSSAQKDADAHPKDPQAWRDLSTALQTEGETAAAIVALNRAIALKPRSPDAYRELAGLHLTRTSEYQQELQQAQIRAAFRAPGLSFPSLSSKSGQPTLTNPLDTAVSSGVTDEISTVYQQAAAEATQAVDAYKQLAEIQPNDPNVQLELAQAAQQTGDSTTAIAAYEKFLKLSPDDPNASVVRAQLKQLRKNASG
ncbi:tetratricopeptide repeat protein [Gaiella sp.]|jgi:Flp pilus assembly protein TadD|uniref:tetratricopeptide repeat protein n=1 Tax=Gaiella sp. TaxID=2663207 RepID=UPI002E2F23C6|nr:tetratricopeptide repeat protein [Gaiella sp.]HEX5582118.1 tetratricopeptide repeat protein [Gaiella sp.]